MKLIVLALLASLLYAFSGVTLMMVVDAEPTCFLEETCAARPWILLIAMVAFGLAVIGQTIASLPFLRLLRGMRWAGLLLPAAAISLVNLLLSARLFALFDRFVPVGAGEPMLISALSAAISCIAVLGWLRWRRSRSTRAAADPTVS